MIGVVFLVQLFFFKSSLGVGRAEDMDHFLDSYLDLTSTAPPDFNNSIVWTAEKQLGSILQQRHRICMKDHLSIKMVPIRLNKNWKLPKVKWEIKPQWERMNDVS